jgi:DNA-binding transcriptional MerR regulator
MTLSQEELLEIQTGTASPELLLKLNMMGEGAVSVHQGDVHQGDVKQPVSKKGASVTGTRARGVRKAKYKRKPKTKWHRTRKTKINNEIVEMYSQLKTAEYLGVTKRTLFMWKREGIIPEPIYKNSYGLLLYSREQVYIFRTFLRRARKEKIAIREYRRDILEEFMKTKNTKGNKNAD